MPSRSPTLAEVLDHAVQRGLADVRIALPARVTRYDAASQTADVQPILRAVFEDETGARQTEPFPVVPSVPVAFPGAGGHRATFPVAVGDTCLLVFSEQSLDKWLSEGGAEVDAGLDHRNHLVDAVAILGLHDRKHPWTSVPTDRSTFGKDGGPQVQVDGSTIYLGATASHGVGLGDAIQTYLDATLGTWLDGLATAAGYATPRPSPSGLASALAKVSA